MATQLSSTIQVLYNEMLLLPIRHRHTTLITTAPRARHTMDLHLLRCIMAILGGARYTPTANRPRKFPRHMSSLSETPLSSGTSQLFREKKVSLVLNLYDSFITPYNP